MSIHNIRAEVRRIDRSNAPELLSRSTGNRKKSMDNIDQIADAMSRGAFRADNGETLKIGSSGALLDGHHRLYAVIKADVAIEFLVLINVPDETKLKMDIGKRRSASNSLEMNRGVGSDVSLQAAGALRMISHMFDHNLGYTKGISNDRTIELFDRFPQVGASAPITGFSRELLGPATALFLRTVFNAVDPALCNEFFAIIEATGAAGHPFQVLRDRLVAASSGKGKEKLSRRALLGTVLRAWAMRLSGTTTGATSKQIRHMERAATGDTRKQVEPLAVAGLDLTIFAKGAPR